MIIDIFSFNGEYDLLELRLNALDSVVDQFIIVEAPSTFCGDPKPLYFQEQRDRFAKWEDKIKYHIVDENYTGAEMEQALSSKYTNGISRWVIEFLHKEALKKAMTHLNDEDICYIGDVDELWIDSEYKGIEKLKLRVYTYYLNMSSTEEFWGPIRARYGDIEDKCLNDVRNDISYRTEDYQGWHFTNQGGLDAVKKKIIDQYSQQSFNGQPIGTGLDERFGQADFIGRDFVLKVDESNWPKYLIDNRDKYKHLIK